MTLSDVQGRVKKAMVAAAVAATEAIVDPDHELLVCYGHPGKYQPDDIISVGRVVTHQDPATFGTNRGRDLAVTITVRVSVYRAGGPEQEEIAGDRAAQLLDALEEYLRAGDGGNATTLGGLARWCFCVDTTSDGITDEELLAKGRCIEIDAQFLAMARIKTT